MSRVDAEFSAKARHQMLTDGTTAVVAIIQDSKIYVGNGTFALHLRLFVVYVRFLYSI